MKPVLLLLSALLLAACSGGGGSSDGDSGNPPVQTLFALRVLVTGSGTAAATEVQVTGGSLGAPHVVMNPVLPWTLTLSATNGDVVLVNIVGSANTGILAGSIQDDPTVVPNPAIYTSSHCGPTVPNCNFDVGYAF